jgi:hypothetical protein
MNDICPWSDFDPGTVSFCEERLCASVVEPSNAWSSIAYIVVGLWLVPQCRAATGWSVRLLAVATACALIGVGSFAFHATGTFLGEVIDQVGMFMLSTLILVYYWGRARAWSDGKTAATYVAGVVLSTLLLLLIRPIGIPLFALQQGVGLFLELRDRHRASDRSRWQPMLQGLAVFSVSFVIWLLDITKVVCVPSNHLVTGHAIWHVLNAVCIAFLFRYYRQR